MQEVITPKEAKILDRILDDIKKAEPPDSQKRAWVAAPQPGQVVGVHTYTHMVMCGNECIASLLTKPQAHLIAAAPDLLTAVETRLEWQLAKGDADLERKFCERHGIDPKKQMVEQWVELGEGAAIAKAKGRS